MNQTTYVRNHVEPRNTENWHDVPRLGLITNKTVEFTQSGTLNITYPCTADDALYYALGGMIDIVEFSMRDKAALEQVDVTLKCAEGITSLSITRFKAPKIDRPDGWRGEIELENCRIDLRVTYLSETTVPVDDLIACFVE